MNRATHPLEAIAAWILALLWLAPLAYALVELDPSGRLCDILQSVGATDIREFCARLESGAVRAAITSIR